MAITLRASASANYASMATVAINVPTGTQNGDFMVMFIAQGKAPSAKTITTPSGWNAIDANVGTDTIPQSYYLNTYWRVASSEPASYTVNTFSAGGADGGVGAILSYSGSSGTMRTHGTVHTSGTASTTSPSPPTLSGIATNDIVLIGYCGGGVFGITAPGGTWNTRVNAEETVNSSTSLCIVDKINGTDTPTASESGSTGWDINSVAIAAISTSTGFLPFLGGPF